jgi:ketosteroid isomerase-like protein
MEVVDDEVRLVGGHLPDDKRHGDMIAVQWPALAGDQAVRPRVMSEENVDVVRRLWDAGDRIVTVYSYRGRGRLSGLPVEELFATVWTLRDRKVVRVQWFIEREEALEAAGLSK